MHLNCGVGEHLAARVPPSPGAGAASVLPPWVWAEGEGYKILIYLIKRMPEGDQPWDFFGRNDAKAETPVFWPPHAKN